MAVEIYSENFNLGAVRFSIELTADQRGLTACRLLPKPVRSQATVTNPYLKEAADELGSYFGGRRRQFKTRLSPDGTSFQRDVWDAARAIPFGQVRSYRWIAEKIGRPRATRAVAQALGANPLLLFVPCHRVVCSNGDLGGFSSGIDWKVLFLANEGIPGGTQLNLPRSQETAAAKAASRLL